MSIIIRAENGKITYTNLPKLERLIIEFKLNKESVLHFQPTNKNNRIINDRDN